MDDKDIEGRLRAHPWPEISPDVRDRVLSSAVVRAGRVSWSDRVWFSREWRFAAAATVVLVIAVDQFTDVPAPRLTASAQAMAEARAIEDLATESGLPAQTAAWLGQRSLLDASGQRAAPQTDAPLFQTLQLDTTGGM